MCIRDRVYRVNWFRTAADGKFLWPGFGENSRVIEWIFNRCDGKGEAVETPIGNVPAPGAIDIDGLDVSEEDMKELLEVDPEQVKAELPQVKEHLGRFPNLPAEIKTQLEKLEASL